jgi:hypothetical protein
MTTRKLWHGFSARGEARSMPELERLARSVHDTFGLHHARALQELRDYLKRISDQEFISELYTISEGALLRSLWEAGLSAERQVYTIERARALGI